MATRQLAAIFLSCIIFGHALSGDGIFGVLLVFAAVANGVINKRKGSPEAARNASKASVPVPEGVSNKQ